MAHPNEETVSLPTPAYQGGGGSAQGLFGRIKGMLPFHLWLMLPTIIVLAVITIYPFIWMVVMSFKETAMDPGEQDWWAQKCRGWGYRLLRRYAWARHRC